MPSKFQFPDPTTVDDDVVAIGGDLEPGTLLQAYRKGVFPMHLQDGRLAWWSPIARAILPLDGLRITRSLRQSTRRFTLSVDADFEAVIDSCANIDRPNRWISDEIRDAYVELHRLGWAHSIEVWDSEGLLVGGLYGVCIGGLFAGESMFSEVSDASKVALVHLVVMLSDGSDCMLDIQWLTPHLERMGGVVIGRDEYLRRLPTALKGSTPFDPSGWGR